MEDKEKQILISVPEQWFKSLLENALDFDEAQKNWEYGNFKNDKIHHKAVVLAGYAKSASSILKYNKKTQ